MQRRAFVKTVSAGIVTASIAFSELAPVAAQDKTYYGLVVNGSPSLLLSYDDQGSFMVRGLRRTRRAAGGPGSYVQTVPPGSAAFPDRALRPDEPLTLKQNMSADLAKSAIERLRQSGGFWYFYVWNTGNGYFDVLKSHAAYASVRID